MSSWFLSSEKEEELADQVEQSLESSFAALRGTFSAVADTISTNVGASGSSNEETIKKSSSNLDSDLDDLMGEETKPKKKEETKKKEEEDDKNAGDTELMDTLENSIVNAEKAVSSALWSTFSSVTSATATATAENKDNETDETNQEEASPKASNSIWTSLGSSGGDAAADAASSLYDLYNSKVNQAAGWIQQLEDKDRNNDPRKQLKESLNQYLEEQHGKGNYEEWIRTCIEHEHTTEALDSHYYASNSPHAKVWNDRCYQDGIDIEDPNPIRNYVHVPPPAAAKKKPKNHQDQDEEVIALDQDEAVLHDPEETQKEQQPNEKKDKNTDSQEQVDDKKEANDNDHEDKNDVDVKGGETNDNVNDNTKPLE